MTPDDDLVPCSVCPDEVHRNEIREHAGQPHCLNCIDNAVHEYDRVVTQRLAYAA
ncbi:hypothetical protein ACPC54_23635 [Kitasatospora sp. NPDC094028]